MKTRLHEFTQALHDSIYEALMQQNISEPQAQAVAYLVTCGIINHFGGENLYIPRNVSGKTAKRNQQIYDEFTGDNHDQLARKYGITRQRVYAIIKEFSTPKCP